MKFEFKIFPSKKSKLYLKVNIYKTLRDLHDVIGTDSVSMVIEEGETCFATLHTTHCILTNGLVAHELGHAADMWVERCEKYWPKNVDKDEKKSGALERLTNHFWAKREKIIRDFLGDSD